MRANLNGRLGLGLAAAAFLLMLFPSLSGQSLLAGRDMLHNHLPMKAASWSGPGGLLSTWNPDVFEGMSYLGDVIQQPFYPPNLLFRLLQAPAPTGIAWYQALHGLLALVGTFLLARRLTENAAAALAGAAFLLSGFMVSVLSTDVHFFCAYAWAPWVLWAYLRLADEGSWRSWALAALLTPMPLYAGDPQAFLQLAAVGGVCFLLRARPSVRRAVWVAGSLLTVVILLCAAQVWATLEILPDLAREQELAQRGRLMWSFHPARFFEWYVPRLYGPFTGEGFWGGFAVDSARGANYIHSAYAGALFPALLLAALRHRPRAALLLTSGFMLFTWFASGHYSFGYDLLLRLVPSWELYRYPQRMLMLPALAAALIMGIGADALSARTVRQRTALLAGSLALALVTLAACVLLAPENPWGEEASRRAVITSLVHLAAVGVGALLWGSLPPSRIAPLLLLVILLADLTLAHREITTQPSRWPFLSPPRVCDTILAEARRQAPPGPPDTRDRWRVFVDSRAMEAGGGVVPYDVKERLPSWGRSRWLQYQWGAGNLLNLCGFQYSVGLTSLHPVSFRLIWERVGPYRTLCASSTRFMLTDPRSRLAAKHGARIVLTGEEFGPAVAVLTDALPRLYRPSEVIRRSRREFLGELQSNPRFLTREIAAIEPSEAAREHQSARESAILAFQDERDTLSFEIRHDRDGYWVLTDTFDAHWRAWIDGAPAPLERADLRHRALWIPAGSHRVRMAYQPRLTLALAAGAALVVLALAGLALHPASASGAGRMAGRQRPAPRQTGKARGASP